MFAARVCSHKEVRHTLGKVSRHWFFLCNRNANGKKTFAALSESVQQRRELRRSVLTTDVWFQSFSKEHKYQTFAGSCFLSVWICCFAAGIKKTVERRHFGWAVGNCEEHFLHFFIFWLIIVKIISRLIHNDNNHSLQPWQQHIISWSGHLSWCIWHIYAALFSG